MCGDSGVPAAAVPLADDPNAAVSFPWASGRVYDAHCHPTDTMASIAQIPDMGAAVLTVMSTRAQDQELVAQLAKDHGTPTSTSARDRVIPAFGWHPWFSYQLYDDVSSPSTSKGDLTSMDDKRQHLASVLAPSPASYASTNTDKEAALTADLDVLAASLAAVRPLSAFLQETRQRLLEYPNALVGEIGIDKAFRVPEPSSTQSAGTGATPGGREGRRLSPFRVQPAHQIVVLSAQLHLAAELRRPVSVHGVQAHGQLYSVLAATWAGRERKVLSKRERHQIAGIAGLGDFEDSSSDEDEEARGTPKRYPPTVCLHSFSGPVDMLRQYLDPRIPATIFFSFSTAVNCSTESGCDRIAQVVAACPDDRILLESDLHKAGPAMDKLLEDIYRRVCAIKKWTLAEGIERIAKNYDAFTMQTSRRRML
ncbi:cut9 interacting protein [Ophiostoma piceae UAMH 11346]|uniref:Cut9 interacting protein n=1 Tax=Ophiostoma piceae (strain UAMH 11346) TaxID=1262450 RepID=S3CQK4_OPHP1|nr:cut9 interacting protein [Ophiostoma piceae UAMH 11346]